MIYVRYLKFTISTAALFKINTRRWWNTYRPFVGRMQFGNFRILSIADDNVNNRSNSFLSFGRRR